MWVSRFVDDIKEEIEKKNKLIARKQEILERMKKGEQFFLREEAMNPPDKDKMSKGAKIVTELMAEQESIDRQLIDIDIIIVSKLEMYLGDFIAKAIVAEKLNSAGDVIPKTEIFLVPFKTGNPEIREVTPEDIWFLKLIKQALSVNNIEIMQKPSIEDFSD
ncbi:MAG: hypothetical protein N2749_00940 [Clostridia bacterium]|nr:hypothetical protein [Clostridia bacterium]